MKAWKTLLGIGFGSLALMACTITTGSDEDDDSPLLEAGAEPDDEPADDTEPGDTDSGTDADDDTSEEDSGVPVVEPPPGDPNFMCDQAAADECEACMAQYCCDERAACAANGTCQAEWDSLKSCMDAKDLMSNPSEDNQGEVDDCASQAAPNGDPIQLTNEMLDLLDCVATDYEAMMGAGDAGAADADTAQSDLVEGDDLCTLACYGVFSTNPVEVDVNEDQ